MLVFATNFVFTWVIPIAYVCGSAVVVLLLVKTRISEGYTKHFLTAPWHRNLFNKTWPEEPPGLRADLIT